MLFPNGSILLYDVIYNYLTSHCIFKAKETKNYLSHLA